MRRHDLRVGSYYLNPTNCRTEADRQANDLVRYHLKQGKPEFLTPVATLTKRLVSKGSLPDILDDAGVLVPVPKSSAHSAGSLWVPHLVALTLAEHGVGSDVQLLLERHTAVPRSSTIKSAARRPSVQQHYDSMKVAASMYPPRRVTLVDDVITIGRTLMASALRILDAFPGVEVRAFVVARSVRHTHLTTLQEMLHPTSGTYRMDDTGFITHDPPH